MIESEVVQFSVPTSPQPQQTGLSLSMADVEKVSNFFELLIKIDQRIKATKTYEKPRD